MAEPAEEVYIRGPRPTIQGLLDRIYRSVVAQPTRPSNAQWAMVEAIRRAQWDDAGVTLRVEDPDPSVVNLQAAALVAVADLEGLAARVRAPVQRSAQMSIREALERVIDLATRYNEDLDSGLQEGLYVEGDPRGNEEAIGLVSVYLEHLASKPLGVQTQPDAAVTPAPRP